MGQSFSISDFLWDEIAVNQKEMRHRPSNLHAEARSPGQPTPHLPPMVGYMSVA